MVGSESIVEHKFYCWLPILTPNLISVLSDDRVKSFETSFSDTDPSQKIIVGDFALGKKYINSFSVTPLNSNLQFLLSRLANKKR